MLKVKAKNHSILVDGSGGRGISPDSWPLIETDKPVGFAGGLGLGRTGAGIARLVAARFASLCGFHGIRTALGARGTDGFLVEANGFQQFLPPAKLDGSGHRAALWLSVVLATAGVA